MEPKRLVSDYDRECARSWRDMCWGYMERAIQCDPLWVCLWNKNHHFSKEEQDAQSDLLVFGLIDGMEFLEWIDSHPEWWIKGEWSDERYSFPLTVTTVGREAFAHKELYDDEDVTGGLMEPGFICAPASSAAARDHAGEAGK